MQLVVIKIYFIGDRAAAQGQGSRPSELRARIYFLAMGPWRRAINAKNRIRVALYQSILNTNLPRACGAAPARPEGKSTALNGPIGDTACSQRVLSTRVH